jgi:glycosyltransferase involved in cell wall biosynthesis
VLSVVVPVWDGYVAHLAGTLRSLRDQDVRTTLVVVDNASTVPVPVPADGDVRLVRCPRRLSVGAARSAGLPVVPTPWVVFWDADEEMPAGMLAQLLDQVRRHPSAVAVSGRVRHGPTGRRYPFPPRWAAPLSRRAPRLFAFATMVRLTYPVIGAALRTDAVRRCGGFPDADAGEDWVLGAVLAVRGRVAVTDLVLRDYQQRPGSLSSRAAGRRAVVARRRRTRDLLRGQRDLPPWVTRAMPLVAVAQAVDVRLLRPLRTVGKRWAGPTADLRTDGRP